MLLIQSLNALDCQEFSSPRRDSGFITQPHSRHLGSPGMCPAPGFSMVGAATLTSSLSPKGGPGSKHPRPCRRWMVAPAPAVPEPELCGDLRAGVLPGVTIWPISGGRHPLPVPRQLLMGTLTRVPGRHGRRGRLVDQFPAGPWGTRGSESTQGVTKPMCGHRAGVNAACHRS